jgi:NAD(P)H-nitrite reductase large subunit
MRENPMANGEDQFLLQRLRMQVEQLDERRFRDDPFVHDKIKALAAYADFIMASLSQPISAPSGGSTASPGVLNCPHCSQPVTVTLS